ncbi:MAG: hypothetical protein PHT80_03430, partial [Lentisphaeria bacterium]|nr:hypothetical protein [Lentisphaeria bacterium]
MRDVRLGNAADDAHRAAAAKVSNITASGRLSWQSERNREKHRNVTGTPEGRPHAKARRLFISREDAKARRRLFYPQITQINADFGGMSCRSAASHAAGRKARKLFRS